MELLKSYIYHLGTPLETLTSLGPSTPPSIAEIFVYVGNTWDGMFEFLGDSLMLLANSHCAAEWFQTQMRKINYWLSQLTVKVTQFAVHVVKNTFLNN